MIMTVITCVMRMIASGYQRVFIMTVSMPIISFPGTFMVQNGKGSCPVGLSQPPGRDQRTQQHHQRNSNGKRPPDRPP
jgi:hypothetical protein